ncbi:hypothetical protein BB559_001828 [Furculomyces boomerangus]|uniref:Uncharacterized protein n=2 Tax=Harpellales TaxID=61421 RepID=A0A2T9Z0B6_9FUNG|nr:hypothetical protein BB559_001828 [Furculomyces boomerangus]
MSLYPATKKETGEDGQKKVERNTDNAEIVRIRELIRSAMKKKKLPDDSRNLGVEERNKIQKNTSIILFGDEGIHENEEEPKDIKDDEFFELD